MDNIIQWFAPVANSLFNKLQNYSFYLVFNSSKMEVLNSLLLQSSLEYLFPENKQMEKFLNTQYTSTFQNFILNFQKLTGWKI